MALNILEDSVGAIIFNDAQTVKVGDKVELTGEVMNIKTSATMVGRVVNPLGEAIDGKTLTLGDKAKLMPVEKIAPGVITRESVNTPLQTGIKAIDAMTPIGRGQRELIIGNRGTGKTAIAIDTIINQKDVICVYVAIGQKESKVAKLVAKLEEEGAMDHTIVVSSGAWRQPWWTLLPPTPGVLLVNILWNRGKMFLLYTMI